MALVEHPHRTACILIVVATWLGACRPQPEDGLGSSALANEANGVGSVATSSTGEAPVPFDFGPVKTAAEYLAEGSFAAADPERGRVLGLACLACHSLEKGGGTLVGPNLNGMFGRAAASVAGFDYSPALSASELVWTPRSLERWLAEPQTFVVGTKMAFTGYRSATDRRDLIAYLLKATQ